VSDLLRAVTDPLRDQQLLRRLTVGHDVDLDPVGALAGDATVRWNFHNPWRNAGRSSARTGPGANVERRIAVTVATIILL